MEEKDNSLEVVNNLLKNCDDMINKVCEISFKPNTNETVVSTSPPFSQELDELLRLYPEMEEIDIPGDKIGRYIFHGNVIEITFKKTTNQVPNGWMPLLWSIDLILKEINKKVEILSIVGGKVFTPNEKVKLPDPSRKKRICDLLGKKNE
jgi:hypothetical protein